MKGLDSLQMLTSVENEWIGELYLSTHPFIHSFSISDRGDGLFTGGSIIVYNGFVF